MCSTEVFYENPLGTMVNVDPGLLLPHLSDLLFPVCCDLFLPLLRLVDHTAFYSARHQSNKWHHLGALDGCKTWWRPTVVVLFSYPRSDRRRLALSCGGHALLFFFRACACFSFFLWSLTSVFVRKRRLIGGYPRGKTWFS